MKSVSEIYELFLQCSGVCTDTRSIIKGSLFVALKGENFNANQFAEQALAEGCSYALIDEEEYAFDSRCIMVEDALRTLQQLAMHHRSKLKIPVVGITGTNGKTTTKELITAVLSKKYKTAATKGNLNNHIGVPLTLLSVMNEEIAIVEMGANHPGEIAMLCEIAKPEFGLITNIGKAHLEGFGSLEGVVNTKKELYDWISSVNGKVFVCRDNGLLMNISQSIERITYGVFPGSNSRGEIIESDPLLKVKWYDQAGIIDVATNLFGYYNFENVMAAICLGNYFGVKSNLIAEAIENYYPSNNRSQLIKTANNIIIMDAYNANPTSMEASIHNFMQMNAEKKFAVIGDMLELGTESQKEHEKILSLLCSANLEHVILAGNIFSSLTIPENFHAFKNSDEVLGYLKNLKPSGCNFLIKGSRGIRLEKVLEAL